jgi:hypothetical protein
LLICYNNCDSSNSRTRNHRTLFIVGPDPRTSQLLFFFYHGKLTVGVVIRHRVCLLLVLLKGKCGETTSNQHFCHTVQGSTDGDLDWSISSVFHSHSLQDQLATRGSKGIRKIWLENIHDWGLVHNTLIHWMHHKYRTPNHKQQLPAVPQTQILQESQFHTQ